MTQAEDLGDGSVKLTRCVCGEQHRRRDLAETGRTIHRGGAEHKVMRCPNGRELDLVAIEWECGGGGYTVFDAIDVTAPR
jgi:hypothetical protein